MLDGTLDVQQHRLIARPTGLPGYEPREWCSVCGKSSANSTKINCKATDCPNVCHISCLGDNEEFSCDQVSNLRTTLNIVDNVVLYVDDSNHENGESANTGNPGTRNEELLQLSSNELVDIINRLQTELNRKNYIVGFFSTVSKDIAKHRDALVTILEFIDNISATTSSLEELEVKSVACTARPEKIDEEWEQKIVSNRQVKSWWTSDKPRKLRNFKHQKEKKIQTNNSISITNEPQVLRETSEDENTSQGVVQGTQKPHRGPNHQGPRGTFPRNNNESARTHHSQPLGRTGYNNTRRNTNPTAQNRKTIQPSNRYQQSHRKQFGSNGQSDIEIEYCTFCNRRGHSTVNCTRARKCDFCHRQGHVIEDCHTRRNEERQEHFFRNLASEQAQSNAVLVQSIQRYLSSPQLNTSASATGIRIWPGYSAYPSQQIQNSQQPATQTYTPVNWHNGHQ